MDRQSELADLYQRVLQAGAHAARSVVVAGPRGIGKTELLKQLFGLLFWRQDRVSPFYVVVNPALLSATPFSQTYLTQFLCQRLAFEKKEQSLLQRDGLSLDGLSALVEDRDAAWARELLDQYRQSSDPLSALRIALSAPSRSALITGTPVAVLIDEFHRLKGLSLEGSPDPHLASFFESPLSYGKTPHVITGNAPEIEEMPVSSGLDRMALLPLGFEDVSSKAVSLLRANEIKGDAPPLLLRRLGGNPFSVECVVRAAGAKKNPEERDFWNAYVREIREGTLARFWSSALKSSFPDLGSRRTALSLTHKIYHANEPFTCRRIAAAFSLTDRDAEATARALYFAGFIQGEFGVFRAVEDGVLRDIVDCLYLKEVLAKAPQDIERELLEKLLPQGEKAVRFDVTLPMTREAELVAAQCLDQIGKNMNLNQDAIGQLQIAVIEACINAMEHGKGAENGISVSVAVEGERMEVSIESAGREFIAQETGEPFGDHEVAKPSGRGWGIKLMKRFADDVRFEKTARGTKTILIKNVGKSINVQKEGSTERE
ncbi:MAG TPA: ATP-binding protein [Nitrospirota bacterium]